LHLLTVLEEATSEIFTYDIEVYIPHQITQIFWGAWDLPDFATPKTFYQEQS